MDSPLNEFGATLSWLRAQHLPSQHSFFSSLAHAPRSFVMDPRFLNELYRRYQAAMHSTRVMAYFLPHLNTVALRAEKVAFLIDADALPRGDSSHLQLRRSWTSMLGRDPLATDAEFGDLDSLSRSLDRSTQTFVSGVQALYPKSLGAWLIVESLRADWTGALMKSLQCHFPGIDNSDYFLAHCAANDESRPAACARQLTSAVLERRPELVGETVYGAEMMSHALDALWDGFLTLLPRDAVD